MSKLLRGLNSSNASLTNYFRKWTHSKGSFKKLFLKMLFTLTLKNSSCSVWMKSDLGLLIQNIPYLFFMLDLCLENILGKCLGSSTPEKYRSIFSMYLCNVSVTSSMTHLLFSMSGNIFLWNSSKIWMLAKTMRALPLARSLGNLKSYQMWIWVYEYQLGDIHQ